MSGHAIGGALLLALGFAGIWVARSLPLGGPRNPGPGFFPFWLSITIVGLSTMALVSLARRGSGWASPPDWPTRSACLRIGFGLALFTAYALVLEGLGYLVSTFLLIVAFAKVALGRSWLASGVLSATAILTSYGLFVWLLGVRLPRFSWW